MGPVKLTPGMGGGSGGGMDPGTATIIAALISAGTQAASGAAGAIGQSQSNKARGRQAAQMDPFIEELMSLGESIGSGGDYGGLRGQASRELGAASSALNAQLAQRGLYSSGVAMQQQSQLAGDVYSQLAQAINADKLARSQIELGTIGTGLSAIQSTPGYGYFDRETGQTQGK